MDGRERVQRCCMTYELSDCHGGNELFGHHSSYNMSGQNWQKIKTLSQKPPSFTKKGDDKAAGAAGDENLGRQTCKMTTMTMRRRWQRTPLCLVTCAPPPLPSVGNLMPLEEEEEVKRGKITWGRGGVMRNGLGKESPSVEQ